MHWVVIALLFSTSVYAVDCAVVLASMFDQRDAYHENRCALNSHKLVNRLIDEGMPAEKVNVVYLLYEGYQGRDVPIPRQADLYPQRARSGRSHVMWPRHVVVEVDGKILDLDYKPEPVPAREYFKAMFPRSRMNPEGGLEKHIRIRVVPAQRNREEFWLKGGDDGAVVQVLGSREDNVAGLPRLTVAEWLDAIAPQPR